MSSLLVRLLRVINVLACGCVCDLVVVVCVVVFAFLIPFVCWHCLGVCGGYLICFVVFCLRCLLLPSPPFCCFPMLYLLLFVVCLFACF